MKHFPNLNLESKPEMAAYLRRLADFGPDSNENHWLRRQAAVIEKKLQESHHAEF